MDPVLNSYFTKFKQEFEILTNSPTIEEQKRKDSQAFEKFVNYIVFSSDNPGIFTGDLDLLDSVCVGGGLDTGIDGLGIRINNKLVRNIDDAKNICKTDKKINIEFVFIQSKMSSGINVAEFNKFGLGVKNFFSEGYLPENLQIREFRSIKDFILNDEQIIPKLDSHPVLYLYYVSTGVESTDENLIGAQKILEKELKDYYFENIYINSINNKQLIKLCRELENQFEVFMNIIDIFPLIVDPLNTDIKKAYAFTCSANEFLKLLKKEDGTLRRALFNDNVRDYLGKNAINREIEQTILTSPEMFLLCNNGITIVCNDFDQVRGKTVKVENPQIVNGCQTSNVIFNAKDQPNINEVQLLIRVISTESLDISNRIVRGTNKQNQVLDEAFEGTLPFHQDILEPFFLSVDKPVKLYYERRSKQYNYDPLVKKTQVVNLRILTQTFVAMFLDAPHEAHLHEAKLLEKYTKEVQDRKIFRDDHSPYPYYICALMSYMFDKYLREGNINPRYKTYKDHLCLIFKYSLGEYPPKLVKSRQLDTYCEKFVKLLTAPQFDNQLKISIKMFDDIYAEWLKRGKSQYGVKDTEEFRDLMLNQLRKTFIVKSVPVKDDNKVIYEGTIFNIIQRPDHWIGFIDRGSFQENVYFDNRSYKGDIVKLKPHSKVEYEMVSREKGNFAVHVQLKD